MFSHESRTSPVLAPIFRPSNRLLHHTHPIAPLSQNPGRIKPTLLAPNSPLSLARHARPHAPPPAPQNAALHPFPDRHRRPHLLALTLHIYDRAPTVSGHRTAGVEVQWAAAAAADARDEGAQLGEEALRWVQEREEEEGEICVYYMQ